MTPSPRAAELLVVFVKHPEPGWVKTRLAAGVGEAAAVAVYRELVKLTLQAVGDWLRPAASPPSEGGGRQVWIYFDPENKEAEVRAWLAASTEGWSPTAHFVPQPPGDLGKRLESIYQQAFALDSYAVAAIGTDCPGLTAATLKNAFEAVRRADLVLGPALDGGYYLIGLARDYPALFTDIPWSSNHTLAATRAAARHLGLTTAELPALADIDTEEDWHHWQSIR